MEVIESGFEALLTTIWAQLLAMVNLISDNSLLLIPVGLGFAGGIIGLGKRLMGSGRRRR